MPLAIKNNAIILKDGKLAENCGCCGGWYCYNQRLASVRVRFTQPAQVQDDEVDGGGSVLLGAQTRQGTADSFNIERYVLGFNPLPEWPEYRTRTYFTRASADTGWVVLSRDNNSGEYFGDTLFSDGSTQYRGFRLTLADCDSNGNVAILGWSVSTRVASLYVKPDILASDSRIKQNVGGTGFHVDPKDFASGECGFVGSRPNMTAYEDAVGGVKVTSLLGRATGYFTSAIAGTPYTSVGGSVYISRPFVTKSVISLPVTATSADSYRAWGPPDSIYALKCPVTRSVDPSCAFEVEVTTY
jgi:hypothetical protein